eukprot:257077-Amphidinium_carterae.1
MTQVYFRPVRATSSRASVGQSWGPGNDDSRRDAFDERGTYWSHGLNLWHKQQVDEASVQPFMTWFGAKLVGFPRLYEESNSIHCDSSFGVAINSQEVAVLCEPGLI